MGGFGDDLIANGNGGEDVVIDGPGKDVFMMHSGGSINERNFRSGTDMLAQSPTLDPSSISLEFDALAYTTLFKQESDVLAQVFGLNPAQFSFAAQSDGINNVYIA